MGVAGELTVVNSSETFRARFLGGPSSSERSSLSLPSGRRAAWGRWPLKLDCRNGSFQPEREGCGAAACWTWYGL
jgi:hypothetical protein